MRGEMFFGERWRKKSVVESCDLVIIEMYVEEAP